MTSPLVAYARTLIEIAVPLAAFVTGLRTTGRSVRWLGEQPGFVLRALLVTLVLVPVGTVALVHAIGVPYPVRAGLTVAIAAVGMGPMAAFKRTSKDGESERGEVGLNVLLLMLGMAFIPVFSALHGVVFQHHTRVLPSEVANVVVPRALLPLAAGALAAWFFPRASAWADRRAALVVNASLLVIIVAVVVAAGRSLLAAGAVAWLVSAVVAAGATLLGHALGGPAPAGRAMVAGFSAIRFPALALLIATALPEHARVVPVVLVYVITSSVTNLVYAAVASKRPAPDAEPTGARVRQPARTS